MVGTLAFVLSLVLGQHAHRATEHEIERWAKLIGTNKTNQSIRLFQQKPWLVNSRNGSETPLLDAAAMGNAVLTQWLVKHGADVNAKGPNGVTALFNAAGRTAPILIKAGIDVKWQSPFLGTAMQYCAMQQAGAHSKRLQATIDAIVAAGYPLDLMSALFLDKRDLARRLIKANPSAALAPRVNSRSALHIAVDNGDVETARMLLDVAKFNPDARGYDDYDPPMVLAVVHCIPEGKGDVIPLNRIQMVELLCDHGANPHRLDPSLASFIRDVDPRAGVILRKYAAMTPKLPPPPGRPRGGISTR